MKQTPVGVPQLYKRKATICQPCRKVWGVKSEKSPKDSRDVSYSTKQDFMNHAGMSPLPKPAVQAMQRFAKEFSETATIKEDLYEPKKMFAELVGAAQRMKLPLSPTLLRV